MCGVSRVVSHGTTYLQDWHHRGANIVKRDRAAAWVLVEVEAARAVGLTDRRVAVAERLCVESVSGVGRAGGGGCGWREDVGGGRMWVEEDVGGGRRMWLEGKRGGSTVVDGVV